MRRMGLSLGLLALGAAMLATAQLASAGFGFKQGGIFRYGSVGPSVQIDPQLAYVSTAWWLELFPGLAIVGCTLDVTVPGRYLQQRLEGRLA